MEIRNRNNWNHSFGTWTTHIQFAYAVVCVCVCVCALRKVKSLKSPRNCENDHRIYSTDMCTEHMAICVSVSTHQFDLQCKKHFHFVQSFANVCGQWCDAFHSIEINHRNHTRNTDGSCSSIIIVVIWTVVHSLSRGLAYCSIDFSAPKHSRGMRAWAQVRARKHHWDRMNNNS